MTIKSEKNYKVGLDFEEELTTTQIKILQTLIEYGEIDRTTLTEELQIARTTIYDNLLKLQKRKLIEKTSRNNGRRGRPITLWKITERFEKNVI